jgi:anaerobic selenocysteine-containing dehydrogenase
MKIDRRSFLSFILGGAAGTALSPLPWKLTDDLAIWTQNWPWTPVPENGEITTVSSVCMLCPGGCGIAVRKVDERVIKIEGLPGHPVNDGRLCILGLAGAQLLYGPQRVQTPLKKVNGAWVKISWEAAIGEIVKKLGELRSAGRSHQLSCINGSDRGTVAELLNRFLTAYGSPNFIRTPSIWDNYEATLYLTQGVRAMAGFDLANSDFVLSFSSGLIEGWGSPVYMFRCKSSLVDAGGRMDQVEPRLSKTGAKANRWIPINPGSEGALALGMAHVIIKEKLYNSDFINAYSAGLDDLAKKVIDGFAPDSVAKMTGIDAGSVVQLAKDFAGARKPLAICGRGDGYIPGSLDEFLAVHTLNALVGNINRKGGVWAVPEPDYIKWPELEMDDIASTGMQQPRLDGAGTDKFAHARYLLNRLPQAVNQSQESPVQVLFVVNANPVYTLPDTEAVQKAFDKIPLVVSFSSYMDETAAVADLILPNHVYLERYEDVPVAPGFPRPILGLCKPGLKPLFDTRHAGDVIIQLAKELGDPIAGGFPWDNYEACLQETLEDKWDGLVKQGYWVDAEFREPGWSQAFETDSSKFEFSNADIDALPPYSPVKAQGDENAFPYLLVPYDTMRLAAGYVGSPPFLIKTVEATILQKNDVLVEINPQTAQKLGLSEGRGARLTTPLGTARVNVHLSNGIMPGVIAMPRGLGHTGNDRYLAAKGVNINGLMGSIEDPATGMDAAWGIRAKLGKA